MSTGARLRRSGNKTNERYLSATGKEELYDPGVLRGTKSMHTDGDDCVPFSQLSRSATTPATKKMILKIIIYVSPQFVLMSLPILSHLDLHTFNGSFRLPATGG